MLRRFSLQLLLPVFIIVAGFKSVVYVNGTENYNYQWDESVMNENLRSNDLYSKDGKHRGMSVFGWRRSNDNSINELVEANVEWVAVIPFFYQEDEQTIKINTPDTVGVWSRRDSTFIRTIVNLQSKGIHVQLKPHLWMNGGWRSNINLPSTEDWDIWFDSYRKNMLHYAQMAEMTQVGMLCIGTELKTSIEQKPERWKELIREIKTIYSGKLTYAANWDAEYKIIDFWDELDYIGVQAYFPLTKKRNPDLETIKDGWNDHIEELQLFSEKHNKPILFTEVGYKSETTATIKPWEWGSFFSILTKKKSHRTQQLAYEALFQKLWDKDWFAGSYIWQWDTRSSRENAPTNLDFSPRFKPAENVIAKWYGRPVE